MKLKKLLPVFLVSFSLFGCSDAKWSNTSTHELTLKQLTSAQNGLDMESTGNQKMLIVPVDFSDYRMADHGGEARYSNLIEKTFFGKSSDKDSDVEWESVASFYEKSSYGRLKFSGVVTDWFHCEMDTVTFGTYVNAQVRNPTWYMLDLVTNWLKSNGFKLTDYDQDGDGYIDGMWMMYANPNCNTSQDAKRAWCASDTLKNVYWAFSYRNAYASPDKENPKPYVYAWASIDFMLGNYGKVDAHTFIHETGHMMGLDDYYNYDYSDPYEPSGNLDMMAYNIGDHNAYSKYLLGWIDPKVVMKPTKSVSIKEVDSVTYTLKPFEDAGQAIILPTSKWNQSPMDEYLIIEFYTPTVLNKFDADNKYQGYYPQMFTIPGVKVYHVDSRLVRYNAEKDTATYSSGISKPQNGVYSVIGASNSASRSYLGSKNASKYKLLHLLESSGQNTFATGADATNDTLFKEGSSFGVDTFKDFTYNNGEKLQYSFTIDKVTDKSCTITFTKIA